ncbi:RHS repeat protein [Mycetohabitans sp. B8]|uniref:RHS repeat domain-containing protein n=1 Tax=Mycetohabitans sp. B8 TaxID=2841845 RepID=UPI001F3441C8|nr:RHS repeat-associated core domain-containing protein [Mycetohabitans sp. B8]MCG1041755.1 RHS repeat protein [Mycetohabitans sp. B8]
MTDTHYTGTPTITVTDNRKLVVRTLQYNRIKLAEPVDERITTTTYSAAGLPLSQTDPRLGQRPANTDDTPLANFRYSHDLAERSLRTDSVDAGAQWCLFDIEGRPIWQQDARGTVTRTEYDSLGRLSRVTEQQAGQPEPIELTRLIYGDNDSALDRVSAQSANLCGVVTTQLDTAGKLTTPGVALTGQPQAQTRQLLANPEGDPDWSMTPPPELGTQAYTTAWSYNARGMPLTQTDAMGNIQATGYDVAGRPAALHFAPVGGNAQTLLASIAYSAAGQVEAETAGNGVTTTYGYEPQTQRLISIVTQRPNMDRQGRLRAVYLQNIHYTYDPVGNIIGSEDTAQPVGYYRNQQVGAQHTYQYDALYQLVFASGRENANTGAQTAANYPLIPLLQDAARLTNYMRRYTYDRGGNLTQIQHQGASPYTQTLVVSNRSNHAVMQNSAGMLKPADIDRKAEPYFDACGNSLQRAPDVVQPLVWNGRNQLSQVTQVVRESLDDRETYQYDGGGMRVRKMTYRYDNDGQTQQRQTVVYLPGLELRTTETLTGNHDARLTEALQVITAGQTTQVQIRVLHWDAGQPADIENDQVRYSLGNAIGSVTLELDDKAQLLTWEEYYPYGGTAVWSGKNQSEVKYKFVRYSAKERDATGFYYYGFRYYAPWMGRWLNPDPAGTVDGLNLYRMVRNNPILMADVKGLKAETEQCETGRYKIDFGIKEKFLLKIKAFKIKIKVLGKVKGRLSKDDKFKLVEVGDIGNKYGLGLDELRNRLIRYKILYENARTSDMPVGIAKNMYLGEIISNSMLESVEREMKNITLDTHFFAILNKKDKEDMAGKRDIYGMVELKTDTENNKTTVIFEHALVHPRAQVHHANYSAEGVSEGVSEGGDCGDVFNIKGVGTYLAVKSINRISKKYNIKNIQTKAVNVRSAAIAKKYGAKLLEA